MANIIYNKPIPSKSTWTTTVASGTGTITFPSPPSPPTLNLYRHMTDEDLHAAAELIMDELERREKNDETD